MPYGVDKMHGGDTPENTAKMERCVAHVKKNNPKMAEGMCIAICKHSIFGVKDDEKPDLKGDKDEDD